MDALEMLFMNNKDVLLTAFFAQYPGADRVEDDPENAIIYPSFRKWLVERLASEDADEEYLQAKYADYAND